MFAFLAYTVVNGGAATYADMSAVADPDFTQRNNHYTFTEQYQLLADIVDGATATRARYSVPTWNAIGEAQIWPMNVGAAVIPSNPQITRYFTSPQQIPLNEEFQVQLTVTAAETDYYGGWFATPDWSRNLPQGQGKTIVVRATGAVAKTLNTWSGGGVLTFAQALRGGVYAVIGAECFCANALFFRLIFPRAKLYRGRKLRPGGLCMNALTDIPLISDVYGKFEWGPWGYFHTFELPQIEVLGNVAGAAVQEVRLWLQYMGTDIGILDNYVGA